MVKTKNSGNKDTPQGIRHLGVLIERVHDDVKLVAEQHGDIKKDISAIKSTLHAHTEMIGNLGIELAVIKEDIEFIKHSLKRKVDLDEFAALEKRVALLEKRR